VAPEAPTVKSFVAILAEAINGRPVADVATISDDILERMGLAVNTPARLGGNESPKCPRPGSRILGNKPG
jgi:sulfur transfer protein SufE